jgi:hypothetical protein
MRWLERLPEEDERLSIEEAAVAASALAALGGRGHQEALATLGGRGHQEALATLSAMSEKATRNARARRVLRGRPGLGKQLVRPA